MEYFAYILLDKSKVELRAIKGYNFFEVGFNIFLNFLLHMEVQIPIKAAYICKKKFLEPSILRTSCN